MVDSVPNETEKECIDSGRDRRRMVLWKPSSTWTFLFLCGHCPPVVPAQRSPGLVCLQEWLLFKEEQEELLSSSFRFRQDCRRSYYVILRVEDLWPESRKRKQIILFFVSKCLSCRSYRKSDFASLHAIKKKNKTSSSREGKKRKRSIIWNESGKTHL